MPSSQPYPKCVSPEGFLPVLMFCFYSGWTPSTFVSSRDQRAKKSQAVEDFMDDEDLEDLKNSRQLENTDTFKGGDEFGTAAELGARAGEG